MKSFQSIINSYPHRVAFRTNPKEKLLFLLLFLFMYLCGFASAYSNNEEDIETITDKALKLELKGNYYGVIKIYDKALETNPHAEIYYKRAVAKLHLEDLAGSMVDLNKAIELKPDFAEAYNKRGLVRWDLMDYENALRDNTKSIELNGNNAEAYYNRGLTRYKLKDFSGAFADFDRAIQLNQQYCHAYLKRGILNQKLGNSKEALADFNKAAIISPEDPIVYKFRAKYFISQNETEKAQKDLLLALELGYTQMYDAEVKEILNQLARE